MLKSPTSKNVISTRRRSHKSEMKMLLLYLRDLMNFYYIRFDLFSVGKIFMRPQKMYGSYCVQYEAEKNIFRCSLKKA
jgi:hypothetical protein